MIISCIHTHSELESLTLNCVWIAKKHVSLSQVMNKHAVKFLLINELIDYLNNPLINTDQ